MKSPRIARLVLPLFSLVALCGATAGAASAASTPSMSAATPISWPIPGSDAYPGTFAKSMTVGPEGNIWFAGKEKVETKNYGEGGLAGFFSATSPVVQPAAKALAEGAPLAGIATGLDGDLWMTSPEANEIVRTNAAGEVAKISLPASLAGPTGIVAGTEGALWFTAEGSGAIGQVSTDGTVRAFPVAPGAKPHGIAVGPDGVVWFTEPGANAIGRLTASGEVASFPLPIAGGQPNQITRGPEGNLWFTEAGAPRVGRITAAGQITEFAAEVAGPIVAGPQGDLWFGGAYGIGSISPAGRLGTTYWVQSNPGNVESMVVGPDGNIWYGWHQESREGGGGSDLLAITSAGVVSNFVSPSPTVKFAKNAKGQGKTWASVRLTAAGGAAGQECGGTLSLSFKGTRIASRKFSFLTDETRWIAVELSNRALRSLARTGKLQVRAEVKGTGVAVSSASVLLHRPPRLPRAH
jgi:virginiamycin B lyase